VSAVETSPVEVLDGVDVSVTPADTNTVTVTVLSVEQSETWLETEPETEVIEGAGKTTPAAVLQ
jgi:hypothetical protein